MDNNRTLTIDLDKTIFDKSPKHINKMLDELLD